ncbi:MAG: hypothetical protein U0136_00790 [Bdellovibrionota bacterium]
MTLTSHPVRPGATKRRKPITRHDLSLSRVANAQAYRTTQIQKEVLRGLKVALTVIVLIAAFTLPTTSFAKSFEVFHRLKAQKQAPESGDSIALASTKAVVQQTSERYHPQPQLMGRGNPRTFRVLNVR